MCRRVCRKLGNTRGFPRAQGWWRGPQRKISVLAEVWMRHFGLVWIGVGACPWQCAQLSSESGHRHQLCARSTVAFTSPRLHGLGKIAFPKAPLQPSPAVRQDQPASSHHPHFNTNPGANLSKDVVIYICLG